MNKIMFFATLGILTILALSLSSAAVIKTIPEQSVWIADGITQYKVHVFLDNSGLNEPTSGVQWDFLNLPNFNFVNSYIPTQNDFYEGHQMVWNWVLSPGELSARLAGNPQTCPINEQGYLGTYVFTVPANTTPGSYSFGLADTILSDPGANEQPHTIENIPVKVGTPKPGIQVTSTETSSQTPNNNFNPLILP